MQTLLNLHIVIVSYRHFYRQINASLFLPEHCEKQAENVNNSEVTLKFTGNKFRYEAHVLLLSLVIEESILFISPHPPLSLPRLPPFSPSPPSPTLHPALPSRYTMEEIAEV